MNSKVINGRASAIPRAARRPRRSMVVVLAMFALLAMTGASLAFAGPALAAQRWVAPTAEGIHDCSTPENAGTIKEGFGLCGTKGAPNSGDEIIVTPGEYAISEPLEASVPLIVRGLAMKKGERPKIVLPSPAGNKTFALKSGPAEVSNLEIENDGENGTALVTGETGSLDENVIAIAKGKGGSAISNESLLKGGLVRDSIAETTGSEGIAINGGSGGSMRAQNVTAFSTGVGSYGIQATTLGFELAGLCVGGGGQVTAENTIAHGVAEDVATINNPGCSPSPVASISLDFSNFRTTSPNPAGTINVNGNNQTSAAQTDPKAIFKNPAGPSPDLHELPGAPTIDEGIEDMLGLEDPEGNPRVLGAGPDIGAFEFVPLGARTTLTTSLSGGGKTGETITVSQGTAVSDTATLQGNSALEATGTISYKVYSDSKCANLLTEVGTPVAVTGGSAPSSAPENLAPGTYYWKARYSGDNKANAPSSSVCGAEIETVQQAPVPPTPTPTPTPPPTPVTQPPALSSVSLTNKRFRVAKTNTAITAKKTPLGSTFRFTLSAAAKLQITITSTAAGLRHGHGCLAPTAKLRRAHAKHCTRTLTVGTLTRANEPKGADSVPFSGRIGNQALSAQSYSAVLSASNAGGRSRPVTLSFTIVR